MAGCVCGSALLIRTCPRLVGRKLHTEGVIAGNGCNGTPNFSRDNGCTCHSMLADGCDGSLLANAPNWLGGIVSGPVRKKRYSRPMDILPNRLWVRSFSVVVFFTLYMIRICRWSCRFSPTPAKS